MKADSRTIRNICVHVTHVSIRFLFTLRRAFISAASSRRFRGTFVAGCRTDAKTAQPVQSHLATDEKLHRVPARALFNFNKMTSKLLAAAMTLHEQFHFVQFKNASFVASGFRHRFQHFQILSQEQTKRHYTYSVSLSNLCLITDS